MLKSYGVGGGRWWTELDYNFCSGPFLTMNFEIDQDHGPRPGSINIFHICYNKMQPHATVNQWVLVISAKRELLKTLLADRLVAKKHFG